MNLKKIIILGGLAIIAIALLTVNMGLSFSMMKSQGENIVAFTIGPKSAEASVAPDYIVDGVDDHVQAQAALTALPAGGGKLVFEVFNYDFGATVSRAIDDVIIEGMGGGTYFANNGADALFSAGSQSGWVFQDFSMDAGGVTISSATKYRLDNVTVGTTYYPESARGESLVVAASNAPTNVKSQADYICDGTADNVEIQAAIDRIQTAGGTVRLSSGTFTLATKVDMRSGVDIMGNGYSTIIDNQGATYSFSFEGTQPAVTTLSADAHPADMALQVASSAGWQAGDISGMSTALYYETLEVRGVAAGVLNLATAVGEELTSGDTVYRFIPVSNSKIRDVHFINGVGIYLYKVSHVEISGCYFYNVTSAINTGAYIHALNIHNNIFNSCPAHNINVNNYGSLIEIDNNTIMYSGGFGILTTQVYNVSIHHNLISGAQNVAIYSRKDKGVLIESNLVNGCTNSDGIVAEAVSDGDSYSTVKVSIINNHLKDVAGAGILVKSRGTCLRRASDFQIIGNLIERNGENPIVIYNTDNGVIADNVINQQVGAPVTGIHIEGNNTDVVVCGNNVRGVGTYDLHMDGSSVPNSINIIVTNNHFNGDGTGPVDPSWLTANGPIILKDNTGYVTEKSGTATVASGATAIVVNHGLATTPTRVIITPRENPTNPVTYWWVDTLTTTQFTINVDADPGASNLDFDWKASLGDY